MWVWGREKEERVSGSDVVMGSGPPSCVQTTEVLSRKLGIGEDWTPHCGEEAGSERASTLPKATQQPVGILTHAHLSCVVLQGNCQGVVGVRLGEQTLPNQCQAVARLCLG